MSEETSTPEEATETGEPKPESVARSERRQRQREREQIEQDQRDKAAATLAKGPLDRALESRGMAPPTYPVPPDKSRYLKVPIDYSPETVQGDSIAANIARGALTAVHGAWDAVAEAAADRASDPNALATPVTRVVDGVSQGVQRKLERLDAQVSHFHQKVEEALKPRVEPTLAAQIRQHWAARGGKLTEVRAAMLNVANGGQATTSAVLSVPAYLSGLTAENQSVLYQEAATNYAPADYAKYREAVRLSTHVEKAIDRFRTEMKSRLPQWTRPQPAALNKLREMAK